MRDCIFTGHCTEKVCDKACPIYVQVSYLLERNNISSNSNVFTKIGKPIQLCTKILDKFEGSIAVIENENVSSTSDLFAYCAICQNWYGSKLNCTVYSLNFSKYLDMTKNSWNVSTVGYSLEYMKIWSESSKVLVINSLDFVRFKDFECQTLLNLIQSRQHQKRTTIVILNKVSELVGDGIFFDKLKKILAKAVVNYDNID